VKLKIHLHGYLAEFHSGPIEVMADTVAEAIESITRQLPGFKPNAIHGRHRIAVVDHDTPEAIYGTPKSDEIHIVPQFAGGKKNGLLQILIGVALVAASFIPGLNATLASIMMSMGASMALGGIAQLLAPQPNSEDEKKSRYLGAPRNTVAIGTRIPILYGEYRVYGHYLSFDIDAKEI
jgi:predicted phage tail protein